jgi:hypothetical protein
MKKKGMKRKDIFTKADEFVNWIRERIPEASSRRTYCLQDSIC